MPQSRKPSEGQSDEVAARFADVVFDDAWKLREEYADLLTRRKANREQLRSLAAQGKLSDEQRAEMEELYPPRTRSTEEAEEASGGAEPLAA